MKDDKKKKKGNGKKKKEGHSWWEATGMAKQAQDAIREDQKRKKKAMKDLFGDN